MTTAPRSLGKGLHLHLDPLSGIAGDMTVAALVHAGVPAEVVTEAIAAMGVPGLHTAFEPRARGAYAGLGFRVSWPGRASRSARAPRLQGGRTHELLLRGSDHGGHGHGEHGHDHGEHGHGHGEHGHDHGEHGHDHGGHGHDHGGHGHDHGGHGHDHGGHEHGPGAGAGDAHRDHTEIRRLLAAAPLAAGARELAEEIFARIAEAEGRLHGMPADRVTFHEVGAYDSIADIVGAAAALAYLEPSGVTASPPVLGSGSVHTAHGLVPVPAPATAALLLGIPVRQEGSGELTTPTGAAILAAVVDSFGPPPPMVLAGQGFGAGTKELSDRANVLRVLLGRPVGVAHAAAPEGVRLIAANLDDLNPQLIEPLVEALFAAGAVDAWTTPIVMKKGRPALEVTALAPLPVADAVARAFFQHSTTLGVRTVGLGRQVLGRATVEVQTRFGKVAVKLAAQDGVPVGATPEFEDCRRLAAAAGVPLRQVHAAAQAAAQALLDMPTVR